jgi:uncharacterized membrane protein
MTVKALFVVVFVLVFIGFKADSYAKTTKTKTKTKTKSRCTELRLKAC